MKREAGRGGRRPPGQPISGALGEPPPMTGITSSRLAAALGGA